MESRGKQPTAIMSKKEIKTQRKAKKTAQKRQINEYYQGLTGDRSGVPMKKQLERLRGLQKRAGRPRRWCSRLLYGLAVALVALTVGVIGMLEVDSALRVMIGMTVWVPVLHLSRLVQFCTTKGKTMPPLAGDPPRVLCMALVLLHSTVMVVHYFALEQVMARLAGGAQLMEVLGLCLLQGVAALLLCLLLLVVVPTKLVDHNYITELSHDAACIAAGLGVCGARACVFYLDSKSTTFEA